MASTLRAVPGRIRISKAGEPDRYTSQRLYRRQFYPRGWRAPEDDPTFGGGEWGSPKDELLDMTLPIQQQVAQVGQAVDEFGGLVATQQLTVGDLLAERELRDLLSGQWCAVWGHSMTFSDIQSQPGVRWTDRLQARLNLGWMLELGQNGSSVQDIANYFVGGGYGPRQFQAVRGIHIIECGAIEMLFSDDGATMHAAGDHLSALQRTSIRENLRAIAAAIMGGPPTNRDEIDAAHGWTMSGQWTTATNFGSSMSSHYWTNTQGSYAEKVLAPGTWYVHLASGNQRGGLPNFGLFDISVGGNVVWADQDGKCSWDNQGTQNLDMGRMVRKIVVPNGTAAERTVRITKKDANGTFVVPDFAQLELSGAAIVPAFFVREFWTGSSHGLDAIHAEYGAEFDTVMAEFPQLHAIDISDGWDWDVHVGADLIHPNDAGQWLFATNMIKELHRILGHSFVPSLHEGEGATTIVQSGARLTYNRTANFTFELVDRDFLIRQLSAVATTASVPNNPDWPIGTVWEVEQRGAGQVTVVALPGVTFRAPNGLKIKGQYGRARLEKIASSEWYVNGDLIP